VFEALERLFRKPSERRVRHAARYFIAIMSVLFASALMAGHVMAWVTLYALENWGSASSPFGILFPTILGVGILAVVLGVLATAGSLLGRIVDRRTSESCRRTLYYSTELLLFLMGILGLIWSLYGVFDGKSPRIIYLLGCLVFPLISLHTIEPLRRRMWTLIDRGRNVTR
jgi:hypothetical protein